MDELPVMTLGIILVTASVVAMVSRRLNLPYSVGLVAAGIALAVAPTGFELSLSRDLIFTVLLPPLIFEAALQLKWPQFRQNLPVTLLLAFPGVAIAAAAVAVGSHFLIGWTWMGAAMFGVLIAATDPVSVIALFKEVKVPPRLSLLVEAESLLNDGAAAVGFAVLAVIAAGGAATPIEIGGRFLWTIFGGLGIGAAVAGALLVLAGRTNDHLVEITLTTIVAYASFLLAERAHVSGVLACLTAGLLVGNLGWRRAISPAGRGHVIAFWEYAAFLANSVVFILIGSQEARQPFGPLAGAAAIGVGLVLLGRLLVVYPLSALVGGTRLKVPFTYQHVLFWGGLRGALALALALALPREIAERNEIIVVAFAIVAVSIFVQGLSTPWLVQRLGLRRGEEAASVERNA